MECDMAYQKLQSSIMRIYIPSYVIDFGIIKIKAMDSVIISSEDVPDFRKATNKNVEAADHYNLKRTNNSSNTFLASSIDAHDFSSLDVN